MTLRTTRNLISNLSRDAAYRDRRFCVFLIPFTQESVLGPEMSINTFLKICTYFYEILQTRYTLYGLQVNESHSIIQDNYFLLVAADIYFEFAKSRSWH
jgi:hypothetical protein